VRPSLWFGTYVNDERLTPGQPLVQLKDGDTIELGNRTAESLLGVKPSPFPGHSNLGLTCWGSSLDPGLSRACYFQVME